jgi:hypothetical protein
MNQIPNPWSIKLNPKNLNDICHKPYENLNYTNPIKKILVIYALNPKTYTNYIMQNKKKLNIGKNLETKFLNF